jgi:hypothetical protein
MTSKVEGYIRNLGGDCDQQLSLFTISPFTIHEISRSIHFLAKI